MISGSNLNISTANFKSNLTPADKTAKTNLANEQMKAPRSKEEIQKELQEYRSKTIIEIVKDAIEIDESDENWITKTIDKINGVLSKKYTPGQLKALWTKERESKEEVLDATLQNYAMMLEENSINGELTIRGKRLGLGTQSEKNELKSFLDSLPLGSHSSFEAEKLLNRTDLSFEEFKKLYAQDVEKTTKANREAVAKINQEMREYNENLAKQRAEAKFKPIQATSKSKTYEDKDIRREFFENFLKAEREKGTDIWSILQKLNKINKVDINV